MDDEPEVATTPNGLIQCLRMLAEEASSLRLSQTFAALQDAIDICRNEVATAFQDVGMPVPVLH